MYALRSSISHFLLPRRIAIQVMKIFDIKWGYPLTAMSFNAQQNGKQCLLWHTTQTVRNKHEKLESKGEPSFDSPFMIQSHAESMKKIVGALQDLPANQHSQSSEIHPIMARLAVLLSWQILKGSHGFLYTFSMACIINGVSRVQVVQLLIHAMLIWYIYIRSSNRIRSNTEIQSSNMFESDIRPSLDGHGIFEYTIFISKDSIRNWFTSSLNKHQNLMFFVYKS